MSPGPPLGLLVNLRPQLKAEDLLEAKRQLFERQIGLPGILGGAAEGGSNMEEPDR